jgi:hypothetical protein
VAIQTIEDLRSHVALATRIELSTIPPYLYAMYTIKDQESQAARLIASVVVEEMLHLSLTTNLLLGIGGSPAFSASIAPSYPAPLIHHRPELWLGLRRCTTELVRDTFMAIERPKPLVAAPEDDDYETLGQFYAALEAAIDALDEASNLFANHQPERQLSDPTFYGPVTFDADDSGGLMLIRDRESARAALEIIVHQGEGISEQRWADPENRELTHFHKFKLIADGRTPIGPVWPAVDNPRSADLPARLRGASDLFNSLYTLVFDTLDGLFSGEQDQGLLIHHLYALMSDCLAPTARCLVSQPIDHNRTAGPTFEPYALGSDPWNETSRLAATVAREHAELGSVAERLSELSAR